jgi:chaperonin cofactor prefoldin
VEPELVAYLDRRFDAVERRFAEMDRRLDELRAELRAEMRVGDAETRRHFDVVAEDLKSRIQLVAEGVLLVDEKLERFRAEVHERFEAVDRRFEAVDRRFEAIDQRFMRLEARVGALEVTVAQALRHRQN